MCPVPSAVHREPLCCAHQSRFGGRLPVPRAEAALPYWVPLSLRPQKQIQKMVQTDIPKATKACSCPDHHSGGYLPVPRDQAVMPYWVPRVLRSCKKIQNMVQTDIPKATKECPCPDHHSGGYLPVPRDQAVMPYWVPRVLRSCKKVVRRQQSFKSVKESPLDSHSWHHRWRICCSRHLLLKWLQLQALHQEGQLAQERRVIPQPSFLPFCLSFLAFLQAVLRAISFIRDKDSAPLEEPSFEKMMLENVAKPLPQRKQPHQTQITEKHLNIHRGAHLPTQPAIPSLSQSGAWPRPLPQCGGG
ncbi:hypothetical protein MDA_GLEAN10022621 [Myotis davidii]|uniref:Uncharacterized protein n=1 Tax=Myotis davidii TaxID=225400 RepID=L5M106_MYODS|nr:hypothetical protein MDA_GLEAN10022621 [Myotis davidii]